MSDIPQLLIALPPILFALTVHEACHGLAALRLGDPTAKLQGRLTLNPVPHLDPIGSILFFLPPHVGWARPVPVDIRRLAHPRRDLMWIALAGPASNVLLAFLFGSALRILLALPHGFGSPVETTLLAMVVYAVQINLMLAAFNLIPLYPLDGSRIVAGLLPPGPAARFQQLERVAPFLLMGIIVLGYVSGFSVIRILLIPFVRFFGGLFTGGIL